MSTPMWEERLNVVIGHKLEDMAVEVNVKRGPLLVPPYWEDDASLRERARRAWRSAHGMTAKPPHRAPPPGLTELEPIAKKYIEYPLTGRLRLPTVHVVLDLPPPSLACQHFMTMGSPRRCTDCGTATPPCRFRGCNGVIATVRKTSFSAGVAMLDAHLFCEEHAMRKASIEKLGVGLARLFKAEDVTGPGKLVAEPSTCDVGADWMFE